MTLKYPLSIMAHCVPKNAINMFSIPKHIYFELGAFIISLFCYQKIRDKPLLWFIPFLLFIVLVELSGLYITREIGVSNTRLFNFTIPVEHFFYTYIFYKNFKTPLFRKIAQSLLVFIPLFALFNMIFIQGFILLNTNILLVGSCIMILLCCFYFVDLFKRDEEILLVREPLFWITTGLLVFNMGELSYNLFMDYILKNRFDSKALLFLSIISLLIYVLYTFISIGLLCIKKPYRRM